MEDTQLGSVRFHRLTGLRFFAALAVYVFHGLLFVNRPESGVVHAIFGQGRSGVSFFRLERLRARIGPRSPEIRF
jgi:peptidoglycan/LPS O-acetylase OafA/YrhL